MKKQETITEDQACCGPAETLHYAKRVKTLKEMLAVQCSDGNWNYDPYMHGMANGMIFALSLFEGGRPEYLEAPDVWLKDVPNNENPVSDEGVSQTN